MDLNLYRGTIVLTWNPYRFLEFGKTVNIRHIQHALKELGPKNNSVSVFLAAPFPANGEITSLGSVHSGTPPEIAIA